MSKSERRKAEARLQALLATSDVLALVLAVMAAYGLRFASPLVVFFPVTKGVPPLGLYVAAAFVLAAALIPTFAAIGLYRPRLRLDLASQIRHAARGVWWVMLVAMALGFFYRGESFSRLTLLIAVILLLLLVPMGRALAVGPLARRFLRPSRLAVVGSGGSARELAARLRGAPEPGAQFVGRFGDDEDQGVGEAPAGRLADVAGLVARGAIDRVVFALDLSEAERGTDLIAELARCAIEIEWLPDLEALGPGCVRLDEMLGMPIVVLGEFPLLGWNSAAKRTMDIALSAAGMLILAPLFAAICVAIKASSRGPIIYHQDRVGRDGRRFEMHKFRTMRLDAETHTGPIAAAREDPRVTSVGRFLRRTSLDELPQLWNVLRGEMSLVGPRPERPCFIDDLATEIPDYLRRQRVKSGMTGWAQIHGLRGGDSPMEARIRCDLYYIENWSLALDLRILFRTIFTLHRQHNAY